MVQEYNTYTMYLMKEPHLSDILRYTLGNLEQYIPQMMSFTDSEIDQQPWERRAKALFVSDTETDVNLMAVLRELMGHSAVPGIFGRSLLEKYPNFLQDIYEMDTGMMYFVMGLPAWTPIPKVYRAHLARQRCWRVMDDYQAALDAKAAGKPDPMWGDLDDVSAFILGRNTVSRSK